MGIVWVDSVLWTLRSEHMSGKNTKHTCTWKTLIVVWPVFLQSSAEKQRPAQYEWNLHFYAVIKIQAGQPSVHTEHVSKLWPLSPWGLSSMKSEQRAGVQKFGDHLSFIKSSSTSLFTLNIIFGPKPVLQPVCIWVSTWGPLLYSGTPSLGQEMIHLGAGRSCLLTNS